MPTRGESAVPTLVLPRPSTADVRLAANPEQYSVLCGITRAISRGVSAYHSDFESSVTLRHNLLVSEKRTFPGTSLVSLKLKSACSRYEKKALRNCVLGVSF